MQKHHHFEVAVIGGGISGCALFFVLSRYTDISSIALFEKYEEVATINSNAKGNSQTLHCGDIETNYTLEKAIRTNKTASMLERYIKLFGYENKYAFKTPKMALGVGEKEVAYIKKRYEDFKNDFSYMQLLNKDQLKEKEPSLIEDRDTNEDIAAMWTDTRISAVDFGEISKTFIQNAKEEDKQTEVFLNTEIEKIEEIGDKFILHTKKGEQFYSDYVVVNAGAHSLLFAHSMGYGLDYSVLPIGGSFYYTDLDKLKSKVYTIQNPKLPFAAVHADPDIVQDFKTRFGPTAIALPKLQRYKDKHFIEFLESLSPSSEVLEVFYDLLKDDDIRDYIAKNVMYEIPGIREKMFVKEIKKIIPTITEDDIYFAEGIGGLRPQVIDKKNKKLLLGEAKIDTKKGIVFNMTPSPGATSCLGNALGDAKLACLHLEKEFRWLKFNKELIY